MKTKHIFNIKQKDQVGQNSGFLFSDGPITDVKNRWSRTGTHLKKMKKLLKEIFLNGVPKTGKIFRWFDVKFLFLFLKIWFRCVPSGAFLIIINYNNN